MGYARGCALRDMHVDVQSASAGHGVGGAGWGRPGAERVREVRWALGSLLEPRLRASKTEWHRLPFGLCPSLPNPPHRESTQSLLTRLLHSPPAAVCTKHPPMTRVCLSTLAALLSTLSASPLPFSAALDVRNWCPNNKHADPDAGTHADRQTDRHTYRQTDRHSKTCRERARQTDKRPTNRQTKIQTNRQPEHGGASARDRPEGWLCVFLCLGGAMLKQNAKFCVSGEQREHRPPRSMFVAAGVHVRRTPGSTYVHGVQRDGRRTPSSTLGRPDANGELPSCLRVAT